jgi:hypothetical protein
LSGEDDKGDDVKERGAGAMLATEGYEAGQLLS